MTRTEGNRRLVQLMYVLWFRGKAQVVGIREALNNEQRTLIEILDSRLT